VIEVKDLHKSFGQLNVLNGVSINIKKGEKVVVIGPSGSGKSTFLRCLNRLEEPTAGQVIFEGFDITDKKTNIDKHRQKMGMVFQHFNLFPHKTILQNMTISPIKVLKMDKAKAEEMALSLLAKVGSTISFTKLDFPLPETPVTQLISPTGISTSTFFKLFCLQPYTFNHLPSGAFLTVGTGILLLPAR
jgi:ABC-type polar amino acid transport system ATPase subunit